MKFLVRSLYSNKFFYIQVFMCFSVFLYSSKFFCIQFSNLYSQGTWASARSPNFEKLTRDWHNMQKIFLLYWFRKTDLGTSSMCARVAAVKAALKYGRTCTPERCCTKLLLKLDVTKICQPDQWALSRRRSRSFDRTSGFVISVLSILAASSSRQLQFCESLNNFCEIQDCSSSTHLCPMLSTERKLILFQHFGSG